MQEIYKTRYVDAFFDAETNTFLYRWLPDTYYFNDKLYKEELLRLYDAGIEAYSPQNVIANAQLSEYILSPDIQTWVVENIMKPALLKGLKRIFFITREDLVQQLSYEQLAEEDPTLPYHIYQWDNEEEAFKRIKRMQNEQKE